MCTPSVTVSSLTFLLWDYFVTLPDEVEFFWTGKWSYLRVLFFVNRYQVISWQIFHTIGIFMVARPGLEQVGRAWVHNMLTISAFTMTTSVQLILSFRVYRLYNRTKWIIGFFTVLLLAAITAQLYVVIKLSPEVTSIMLPFLHITCQPTLGAVSHLYLGPITAICFDIPAFLLVLLRGITHFRVQKAAGFRGSSLVRLLVWDSVLYFLMIVVVYTIIIISYVKFPDIESFMTFGYGFSVISIAASQMLINLRKH
ncbi:hypothetical protein BDN71DRAFT_913455 [Pleurotus eryngii]|uniref:DUF6533 domain-containing protein n=1 Tax=Pleurotus eryngii TaxID=5323 RepID=A0A9P5ZW31_PLEER|nr:hypothetical protein BDN71DRAFT_913455 [Pleurotus eryngii]